MFDQLTITWYTPFFKATWGLTSPWNGDIKKSLFVDMQTPDTRSWHIAVGRMFYRQLLVSVSVL